MLSRSCGRVVASGPGVCGNDGKAGASNNHAKSDGSPVVTVGGVNAGILPSPERKVRKTSHQEQILGKQNERTRVVLPIVNRLKNELENNV